MSNAAAYKKAVIPICSEARFYYANKFRERSIVLSLFAVTAGIVHLNGADAGNDRVQRLLGGTVLP